MYADGTNPSPPADPASPAAASLPTSPRGEVAAQRPVGAPALPSESPSESPFAFSPPPPPFNPQSQIPNPKSDAPVTTAYPNLPNGCSLPTDAFLLARVAQCNASPIALAQELGINLDLLLDWMTAPDTVRRLNALIEAGDLVEQTRQKAESARMLASLASAHDRAVKADDHVEQRRAAIAYLRFANRQQAAARRGHFTSALGSTGSGGGGGARGVVGTVGSGLRLSRFPAKYRSRARFVRTIPILHEPPAVLVPPEIPNPVNSPAQATIVVLQRLQDSDNPCDGDGLRTLFNYFSPEWRNTVQVKTADEFACTDLNAYHQLLGHHSAVLQPTVFDPVAAEKPFPRTASQAVNFIDIDGEQRLLTLTFRKNSGRQPWLIDRVHLCIRPGETTEPNTS